MKVAGLLAATTLGLAVLGIGVTTQAEAFPLTDATIAQPDTSALPVSYTARQRAMHYRHKLAHSSRGARFEYRENHRMRCNKMPSRC